MSNLVIQNQELDHFLLAGHVWVSIIKQKELFDVLFPLLWDYLFNHSGAEANIYLLQEVYKN